MTAQIIKNPIKRDLSLLAIEAAEELERSRRKFDTDFKSAKELSSILEESLPQEVVESGGNIRLDYASVFSSAISNSFHSTVTIKTISDLTKEASRIVALLKSEDIDSIEDDVQELISFCVALSDSAALYKEELEELKKHIA